MSGGPVFRSRLNFFDDPLRFLIEIRSRFIFKV